MLSTMQDAPLTVNAIFRHGAKIHAASEVVTYDGGAGRRARFSEVAARTAQLAGALRRLGIGEGDRVGSFCWNQQEHLEAYFAVPCMGAVLHTLNIRLFVEQLAYIIDHGGDRAIIVDATLAPLLGTVLAHCPAVEHVLVIGDGDCQSLSGGPVKVHAYEALLAAESPSFDWPEMDERSAASMCYTSGTTGNPKGVVYSHRSTFVHTLAECAGDALGISCSDRILMLPSMFHANSWGLPFSAWLTGADILMPGRFLQSEPLCRFIRAERPTFTSAVPTVFNDLLRYAEANGVDLGCFRLVLSGGAPVPVSLIERFRKHGVRLVQGWGMTETSPLAAVSHPPKHAPDGDHTRWLAKTGRVAAGVEVRLTELDRVLEWDGKSVGEIEIRGPWITGSYYCDPSPDKFHDGWLRTGDVGTIDEYGFIQITDRTKDVIKSGGEWISSVELENHLMSHPDVIEAAVIGVPDARWDERPLACVVLKEGATVTPNELREFLAGHVAHWWLPERWSYIPEVPRTSVGKFDKKVLRAQYAAQGLQVIQVSK